MFILGQIERNGLEQGWTREVFKSLKAAQQEQVAAHASGVREDIYALHPQRDSARAVYVDYSS